MHIRNRSAIWCLGISVGLVAGAVLSRRSAKRTILFLGHNHSDLDNGGSRRGPLLLDVIPGRGTATFGASAEPTPSVQGATDKLMNSHSEPGDDEPLFHLRRSRRPPRVTDWVIAVSMAVVALSAVYYVRKSNEDRRLQYQLWMSSRATAPGAAEWTGTDQRPWVGLPRPTASPLGKQGGGFVIRLQNFGKTPAINVFITDYVLLETLADLTGMQETADAHPVAVGILMPDDKFDTNVWFKTSPEGVTSVAQGKVRAVNYALIVYEDIFHHRHTTQSCYYWHGGLQAPLPCERFNNAE